MKNKSVSVIIPVYNGERFIKKCLDSLLNQSYKNYDIIIVNNNSTDKTIDIANSYLKNSKKVKCVNEKKQGVGIARNRGILNSSGEILCFTDIDCIAPSNWIEELTEPIRSGKEKIVSGFQKDLVKNFWSKHTQKAEEEFSERNSRNGYITILDGKNFAIYAELAKEILFDEEIKMADDFEFCLRARKKSRIKFLPNVKVGHYHRSTMKSLIKTNFIRGYWIEKIYQKHKKDKGMNNEPMFESLTIKSYILFFPWAVLQFFKKPLGEAFFILIFNLSWRGGVIWAKIK